MKAMRTPDEPALIGLRDELRAFASARDWDQFHSPKNLAIALSVEVSELLEHFLWQSDNDSFGISKDKLDAIDEEIADVFLYLIRIADKLSIDLVDAARRKILMNARKYPVEKARGNAKKYTQL